uniref:Metastasis-associated protein MTA3 n=1 Tax=Angiostrongylus cantonensis TaxID=6313 RepID=A0A158P9Z8_ANGCA
MQVCHILKTCIGLEEETLSVSYCRFLLDYVYFETPENSPYQIRRIEDLNKTSSGQVEARVTLYYRRRDISSALLKIADQAERRFDEYYEEDKPKPEKFGSAGHTVANGADVKIDEILAVGHKSSARDEDEQLDNRFEWGSAGLPLGVEKLSDSMRHRMRQRELFLSRRIETLPATLIRGKCQVTLLSEVETVSSYEGEDKFFYSLVYDPCQMTLLADKGAIRVGEKYQAEVPESMECDDRKENGDGAVGTFSRALDTSSSTKLPSLHMTAAAASRDVTLLHAMALLHQAGYDIGQAVKYLVPPPNKNYYPLETDKATGHNTVSLGGPILCRDQIEEWSAAEANLFEDALEKYGKDFSDVRVDFLPWKSARDIVEYYYMWKTTNRYVEQKKKKNAEHESKLKQVYIPNHAKTTGPPVRGCDPCEGCKVMDSSLWHAWGPSNLQLRLCQECWIYWKKYGGLKERHEYDGFDMNSSSSDEAAAGTQENAKPILNNVNPLAINKSSSAAQKRPLGAGHVIARLPSNHPLLLAAAGSCGPSTSSSKAKAQHHQQQQQALKRPASTTVSSEPGAKREKLSDSLQQVGAVAIAAAAPSPSASAMLSPKPSKWDSVWRWQPGGQFVFLAGPLFRRKRAELLPRETLGHQIGRRVLIAKENDARVSNHVKVLMQFLPPMPSENPSRRLPPHQGFVQNRLDFPPNLGVPYPSFPFLEV